MAFRLQVGWFEVPVWTQGSVGQNTEQKFPIAFFEPN